MPDTHELTSRNTRKWSTFQLGHWRAFVVPLVKMRNSNLALCESCVQEAVF